MFFIATIAAIVDAIALQSACNAMLVLAVDVIFGAFRCKVTLVLVLQLKINTNHQLYNHSRVNLNLPRRFCNLCDHHKPMTSECNQFQIHRN